MIDMEPTSSRTDLKSVPRLRTGWRRLSLVALGLALVGMGYLGVLLPGLPTTPFLLAASYCFIRSSPRLHRWLRRSPVLGRILHDWEVHRGIRRPVKIFAIVLVVAVVTSSIVFSSLPVWLKVTFGCLALVGITVILCVPTVGARNTS
jgi:uncharacterized membrane protein YbaN (DUF454 family)